MASIAMKEVKAGNTAANGEPECIWDAAAHLGEGVLWHAKTRSVYFVDIKGRRIHRCDADGSGRRSWEAPGQPGFVVPAADGSLVCAMEDGLYRLDEASGAFTLLRKIEDDLPGNRFNDGYVDAGGNLWFGSMDDAQAQATGALYRLDRHGALSCADQGYIITNGPAISPDGKTLYHTDTPLRRVYAFDLRAGGVLANKRVFLQLPRGSRPDGMAVDSEGHLWIALFGAGRAERYTAAGRLAGAVRFPCTNITKLAFGGDDLRTVYVSTAWKGLTPAQRLEQPLAGGLFSFRVDTPGLPHNVFAA
jgi:D-xylonolactonase